MTFPSASTGTKSSQKSSTLRGLGQQQQAAVTKRYNTEIITSTETDLGPPGCLTAVQ